MAAFLIPLVGKNLLSILGVSSLLLLGKQAAVEARLDKLEDQEIELSIADRMLLKLRNALK